MRVAARGALQPQSHPQQRRCLGYNAELRAEALRRVQREVVREQTGGVRRGHGGARERGDGDVRADVRGEDVQSRREDVNALAVVGEVRALVAQRGGTDGDGLLSRGGGIVACVAVVVAYQDRVSGRGYLCE